jgi:hypothetical protein
VGPRRPTLAVLRALALWLFFAIITSTEGLTERLLQPPLPPVLVVLLTVMVLTVAATSAWFREWLVALDVRVLVLVHVTRFVAGLWFLVLYTRGALPYAFAVPGGIGDMLVAVLAVGVALVTDARATRGRRLLIAWNVVGLIDILMVVGTAGRSFVVDPPSMVALLRFPLSLVPTFLVPIIIATHVILFARVWRMSEGARR